MMDTLPLGIIVAGASGRMGQQLVSLVMRAPALELAGVVDVKERLKTLESLPCVASDSLKDVMAAKPQAVTIDFSSPAASGKAAETAASLGCRLVIGTTGFNEAEKASLAKCAEKTPILWSANMSVGVNALLALLPALTRALGPDYDIEMMEMHHRHKKDAPSGTALMLAKALGDSRGWNLEDVRNSTRNGLTGERPAREIGVQALRGGDVVGIHSIYFLGTGEMIEVKHQAESRENFSQGALRAAVWLSNQKAGRLYSMLDVLGLAKMAL